jgi:hypothetical protein
MSNGSARDKVTEPLPRRGADGSGRIPTRYGPSNPVSERLKRHQFRVRPGAPSLPIPEPQQAGAPTEEPLTTYAVRPGTPSDPAADPHRQVFEAIAEKKTAEDRRRRRFWLGTALVALIGLVGACVALVGSSSQGHRTVATGPAASSAPAVPAQVPPTAQPTTQPTAQPTTAQPSTAAPATTVALPDPVTLISDAGTDTAPLSTATLFPGKSVTVHGHSYTRVLTTASACSAAATPPLAAVLAKDGCRRVFRATYRAGTTAVTVGVAVFDTAAQAAAVKQQATGGNLVPLAGGPLPAFCHAVPCRLSVNAFGRYAYFNVAGYTTGKPVLASDTSALAAGTDMGAMAFQNLADRARDEAATATP